MHDFGPVKDHKAEKAGHQGAKPATIWPALVSEQPGDCGAIEQNVARIPTADEVYYRASAGPAADKQEGSIEWRLNVPGNLVEARYAVVAVNHSDQSWVALESSFDGKDFREFFRKSNAASPVDELAAATITRDEIPRGTRQATLRCRFETPENAGTYRMPGVGDALMTALYEPKNSQFEPIEIVYRWIEHRLSGDVERSHTEVVRSLPHEYAINVAGYRDPTMRSVSMRLVGAKTNVQTGYSDGKDVGVSDERSVIAYEWGRNIAEEMSYTSSRSADIASLNGDDGGTELTNRVIVAPTDLVADPRIRPATAFWSDGDPVAVVVDLKAERHFAGVRVSTHQPNAEYCHPQQIDVAASDDGSSWREIGSIAHGDVWNPPADYEPWEHDDDPTYEPLPAQGRLQYSFPLVFAEPMKGRFVRFTFKPQSGRGMGISEIQIFDAASAARVP